MDDSERIPFEDQLSPAPGMPVELLRGQIEVAKSLHAAIQKAVAEGTGEVAEDFSIALTNVLHGVALLTDQRQEAEVVDLQEVLRAEVTRAFEDVRRELGLVS